MCVLETLVHAAFSMDWSRASMEAGETEEAVTVSKECRGVFSARAAIAAMERCKPI